MRAWTKLVAELNGDQDDSWDFKPGYLEDRTEKLEGAGLGKEKDKYNFGYMEYEFWVAFQLEVVSMQDWYLGEISELVMYVWNWSS